MGCNDACVRRLQPCTAAGEQAFTRGGDLEVGDDNEASSRCAGRTVVLGFITIIHPQLRVKFPASREIAVALRHKPTVGGEGSRNFVGMLSGPESTQEEGWIAYRPQAVRTSCTTISPIWATCREGSPLETGPAKAIAPRIRPDHRWFEVLPLSCGGSFLSSMLARTTRFLEELPPPSSRGSFSWNHGSCSLRRTFNCEMCPFSYGLCRRFSPNSTCDVFLCLKKHHGTQGERRHAAERL